MTEQEQHILDKVRESIGEDRMANVIVYVSSTQLHANEEIKIGDVQIEVPWAALIAFIDLEPKANWGHACCYLAIREGGEDVVKFPAHMPPFLKADSQAFRFIWRGPNAPEWAVVTPD